MTFFPDIQPIVTNSTGPNVVISVGEQVHFSIELKEVAEIKGEDVIQSYSLHTSNITAMGESITLLLFDYYVIIIF